MKKQRKRTSPQALARLKRIERAFKARKKSRLSPAGSTQRNFLAGVMDSQSDHFRGLSEPIDAYLATQLERLVARSRWLAANESYMARFLQIAENSIVGRKGLKLVSRAVDSAGKPDKTDRSLLEDGWKDWCRAENCDVTRRRTYRDIQASAVRSLFTDGEALVRMVAGHEGSAHRFALQMLDPMLLDPQMNMKNPRSGNMIRLGIEVDSWGAPVRYWLRQRTPTQSSTVLGGKEYLSLEADEVIHLFRPNIHAMQSRGAPASTTAILRLEMLHGAEEAELTAARVGASKMGFYKSEGQTTYTADGEDELGNLVEEAEPGLFTNLPAGVSVEMFDPKHPNNAFPDFTKLMLRGAASGLGVGYNFLANDLEGVTYGSLRNAAIEDREHWRVMQDYLRDALVDRTFRAWVRWALLTGAVPLPPRKREKLQKVDWVGRGFPWIDPAKEQAALKSAILETRTASRTAALAAQGEDFEDVLADQAREKEMAAVSGVDLEPLGGADLPGQEED